MNDFLTTFLLPILAILTLSFIGSAIWFMFNHKKHEAVSASRHGESMGYNRKMHETLKKVDSQISEQVIPQLGNIFKEKSEHLIKLTTENMIKAIDNIGASSQAISEDGELILSGWQHEEQKVYFLVKLDLEAKDIMVEGFSNKLDTLTSDFSEFLLKYNEQMKVSGVCIEEVQGNKLLKTQQLIDAPDGVVNLKTLDFVFHSLMESQIEIQKELEKRELVFSFFPPEEYLPLRQEASMPNKSIKQD